MPPSNQQLEIEQHFHSVLKLLGFDRSEMSTARLVNLLSVAAFRAKRELKESRRDGLGLNTVPIIAESLIEGTQGKSAAYFSVLELVKRNNQ